MIYTSVSGAVVAALAAGEKGAAKGQAWQKLYNPNEEEGGCLASLSSAGGELDRTQVDYWVAARLHHLLIPRHWDALVAKYSTSKAMKVKAIAAVKPLIASPAKPLFVFKAVTAWAIPKLPGAARKGAKTVSLEIPLETPAWRREAVIRAAVEAGVADNKRVEAVHEDVIILPESFYDMNTWDLDAAPESTRRRWRADINERLNDLVAEALGEAQRILEAEGLMLSHAA